MSGTEGTDRDTTAVRPRPYAPGMRAAQRLVTKPSAIYPSARDIRAAVQAGDWPRVVWITTQVDASERTQLVIEAAADGGGQLAQRQLAERPDDSFAAAVLAEAMIDEAWRVRGSGRADTVGKDSFATFHEILQGADRVLHDAIAQNEDDPALWTASLPPALGLGLGRSEAAYRYEQVRRCDPHVILAQGYYLQYLLPKWYGSWKLAAEFADTCARQSPPGSLDAMVVPQLHIEHVIDTDAAGGRRYAQQSTMGAEVWQAAHHSVWNPQFAPRYGWVQALHTFACAFALLGDQRNAVALLDRTGPYGSEAPWNYFGDPSEMVARARAGQPLREKKGRRL